MTDLRTAAQQALEALEFSTLDAFMLAPISPGRESTIKAITALRDALAEPDLSRCPNCKGPAGAGIELLREAVAAEREACAAFLESGVDLAGLAGDPMMQAFTGKLLIGCAKAIRARGEE